MQDYRGNHFPKVPNITILEILREEIQGAVTLGDLGIVVEKASFFSNDLMILPKRDSIKLVIAAQYLN